MVVSDEDLFQIRAAASEWLKEHKDSLNASNVRTALINTNPPIPQPGQMPGQGKSQVAGSASMLKS